MTLLLLVIPAVICTVAAILAHPDAVAPHEAPPTRRVRRAGGGR